MRRKRKSNYKKYIFMGIFVVVAMVIILVSSITAIINNGKKQNINQENIVETNTNMTVIKDESFENTIYANVINEVEEKFIQAKQVVPENYNFLTRLYEGKLDDTILYERIYRLVFEVIPDTYKDLKEKNDTEIAEYYKTYQVEIYNLTGIENEQGYINFVKSVNKIGEGEYVSSVFAVNNFVAEEDYSIVDLTINFTTGSITFETHILNNTNEDLKDIKFIVK